MKVIEALGLREVVVVDGAGTSRIIEIYVGARGAVGPAGPIGPSGADTTRLAGATILFGQALRVGPGEALFPATSDDATDAGRVIGLATSNALIGESVTARAGGSLSSGGWSWTPGSLVFLGADGLPTQSLPSSGFVQPLGYAATGIELVIQIGLPITLGA